MNRSLFWTTFGTVFLAEVGDKTQLAAMTATVRSGQVWKGLHLHLPQTTSY